MNGKIILCCLGFLWSVLPVHAQFHQDTLVAIRDSYVRSSSATTNYGSTNPLEVAVGLFGSNISRTLVQFDLSSIPKDAKITSAVLVLTRNFGINGYAQYLRKLTSGWDEYSVTWNTQPSFTATGQISVAGGTSEDRVSIDVLSHLPEMVCLSNFGWGLHLQNESSFIDNIRYYSREESDSTLRPQLFVNWYEPISLQVVTAPAANLSASDGAAQLTVNGGRSPFSYEWRNTSNTLIATTQDITGQAAGLYKLKITDANATVYYAYVIIPSYQDEMTVNIQPDPDYGIDANLRYALADETVERSNYGSDTSYTAYRWGLLLPSTLGTAVIRFNFFGLPPETLLKVANLYLYGSLHIIGTESFLDRITSAWCEACVTYATAPSTTTTGRITLPAVSTSAQNYTLGVQDFVRHYLDNPTENYGYLLSVTNTGIRGVNFYSSDEPTQTGKWPKLELTFRIPTQYATLTRRPDGGTYRCNERLYFHYHEEYKELDGKLRYNLYNLADNSVKNQDDLELDVAYGDNYLVLDLGASGLDLAAGYYLLEVVGQKEEKFYLRVFKTN